MRYYKSILAFALTSAIALTMVGCGTTSTEKDIASTSQDYVVTYEDGNIHLREDIDVEQKETAMDYDPDMVIDIFSELEPYLVYSGHDENGKVDLQFPEGLKWQVGDYYFKSNGNSYYNMINVIYDNEVVNTITYHIRTPENKLRAGEEFTVYTICESSLNQMFKDTGSEYVVLGESKYDNSSVHVTTTVEKNYVFPSIATPLKNYSDFKDEYIDTIQQYVADYWHNSSTGRVNDDVEVCEAVLGCVKEGEIALYGGEKVIIYVRMKNHSLSGIWASTDDVYALTGLAITNEGEFRINGIHDAGNVYNDTEELLADKLAASDISEAYDLFVLKRFLGLKNSIDESATEEKNYIILDEQSDFKVCIEDIESKLKLEHASRHSDRTPEQNEDVELEEIAVCSLKKGEVTDKGNVILYALMLDWNDDKYIMYELTELEASNTGGLVIGGIECWKLNLYTDFLEYVWGMDSYDSSFHRCE